MSNSITYSPVILEIGGVQKNSRAASKLLKRWLPLIRSEHFAKGISSSYGRRRTSVDRRIRDSLGITGGGVVVTAR
jgi:hypothetical protein